MEFQSTHPRGVRPDTVTVTHAADTVSIHAPARGATTLTTRESTVPDVSIHAPARGATSRPRNIIYFDSVSIHAPARGATFSKKRILPHP